MLALKLYLILRCFAFFFEAIEFARPLPSHTICLCQSAVRFSESLYEQAVFRGYYDLTSWEK